MKPAAAGHPRAAASPPVLPPRAAPFSTSSGGGFSLALELKPQRRRRFSLRVSCLSEKSDGKTASYRTQNVDAVRDSNPRNEALNFEVRSPLVPASIIAAPKLSLNDQAFLLLAFFGCTASVAFTGLVIAAVPTLFAMRRAAISLSKLADTAREELPGTMAAVRLSGMEISDLTLELSDLSQEISDGVNKSAQAVQAAEAGIRKIGSLARQQTMSMIEESPVISIQPVVVGAAKKTSRAVSRATKTLLNYLSGGENNSLDRIQS